MQYECTKDKIQSYKLHFKKKASIWDMDRMQGI